MELLQLKYFCHAAETQNFSRTARTFLVPHSNISQCIKKLETELGTPLFDRSGNRVVLNAKGQAFYREIRSALDAIENATFIARGDTGTGTIRVGVHLSIRIVMAAITTFQRVYPNVDIISKRIFVDDDISDFDLITSDDTLPAPGFVREKLFTDKLCLVAAKGTLPDSPPSVEYLHNQPFITVRAGSRMYSDLLRVCESMGFSPRIALQCEDSFFVLQNVEAGLGHAIVPYSTIMYHAKGRVDFRELGDFSRTNCIYWSKKRQSSPEVDCLLDSLRERYKYIATL